LERLSRRRLASALPARLRCSAGARLPLERSAHACSTARALAAACSCHSRRCCRCQTCPASCLAPVAQCYAVTVRPTVYVLRPRSLVSEPGAHPCPECRHRSDIPGSKRAMRALPHPETSCRAVQGRTKCVGRSRHVLVARSMLTAGDRRRRFNHRLYDHSLKYRFACACTDTRHARLHLSKGALTHVTADSAGLVCLKCFNVHQATLAQNTYNTLMRLSNGALTQQMAMQARCVAVVPMRAKQP